jgi:hypothetical protein
MQPWSPNSAPNTASTRIDERAERPPAGKGDQVMSRRRLRIDWVAVVVNMTLVDGFASGIPTTTPARKLRRAAFTSVKSATCSSRDAAIPGPTKLRRSAIASSWVAARPESMKISRPGEASKNRPCQSPPMPRSRGRNTAVHCDRRDRVTREVAHIFVNAKLTAPDWAPREAGHDDRDVAFPGDHGPSGPRRSGRPRRDEYARRPPPSGFSRRIAAPRRFVHSDTQSRRVHGLLQTFGL